MLYKTPERITINGVTQTVYNETAAKYVYEDGAQTPCAVLVGNKEYLLVRNLFGDTTAIIDSTTGTTVINFSYDPWGNMDYSFTTGVTDAEKEIIKNLCAVTYRGYNYDFDTGLYYLQSRYYNPQWGRFINADDTSILLATKGTLLGSNLFAYCENNPINRVDFSGRTTEDLIAQIVQGLVTLFVFYYFAPTIFINNNYEGVNMKQITNEYGLIVANIGVRDVATKKYYVLKLIYGSPYSWKKYGRDNEYLGMSTYEYNSYYNTLVDINQNNFILAKNEVEGGYGETPNALFYGLIYKYIEDSRENNRYENYSYVKNLDRYTYYGRSNWYSQIMVAYKKYNSLSKVGMQTRLLNYSIPKFDDIDSIWGI